MGQEPKVVAAVLRELVERRLPHSKDGKRCGEAVTILAEQAGTSPRTIYRLLDPERERPIDLDTADRLLIAVGGPSLGELDDDAFVTDDQG